MSNLTPQAIACFREGTPRQQQIYPILTKLRLDQVLETYDPHLVGTIPLDIDIPTSDIDVLCDAQDLQHFRKIVEEHYATYADFNIVEQSVNQIPTLVANFTCDDVPIEIFAQACPVKEQNGYLHKVIEERLLTLAGDKAREEIRQLKVSGMKTEPAFAHYFHLSGDPYTRLRELVHVEDAELQIIIDSKMDAGISASEEKAAILTRAHEYVQDQLKHDASGHDWWHIYRVVQTAKTIAKQEKANAFVCELAALMHDLADDKVIASEEEGLANIKTWLVSNRVDAKSIEAVLEIITTMSFKGGNRPPIRTLEGKVVQDADRLDAIGAMGISRVFAYSGAKQRIIHDPAIRPRENMTTAEYRSGEDTAINHFYEKLLKLKDLMNTNYGKQMADERHRFMENYLEQFYMEWDGLK
ncbi:DUF4269 domain-containing protein [Paenibacillus sp. KN14-4R]|uniref:DUF4269 domain-containing protein n=1 Tax=Paenibacillus sp. KN14-4R TaxID=3445773 RepID=UPI003FA0443B